MHFKKILVLLAVFTFSAAILPATGFAELRAMNDEEMTEIYATGFSSFEILEDTITGIDTARAWFNIEAYTFTEIDSLKLGYHNNYDYKNPNPGFGWDEDWINVQFGGDIADPSEDFHASGFYFEADFTDIDDPDDRELKSVRFGFDTVEGDIYANFINFSGTIDDSNNNTPEYNGHILNLGPATITSDGNGGMEISLNIDTYDKGYWVTFDSATVTPTP